MGTAFIKRNMKINDTWFGMEGDIDGNPYIIRGREDINIFQKSGSYQTRIDICLTYIAHDESSMPDNDQVELMERVEGRLIDQLENDLEGILAFVFTGNSQRVWYWYCKNQKAALERTNIALAAFQEKLPIEIYSAQDPQWDEYNNLID
jgi:hypothetical protein